MKKGILFLISATLFGCNSLYMTTEDEFRYVKNLGFPKEYNQVVSLGENGTVKDRILRTKIFQIVQGRGPESFSIYHYEGFNYLNLEFQASGTHYMADLSIYSPALETSLNVVKGKGLGAGSICNQGSLSSTTMVYKLDLGKLDRLIELFESGDVFISATGSYFLDTSLAIFSKEDQQIFAEDLKKIKNIIEVERNLF